MLCLDSIRVRSREDLRAADANDAPGIQPHDHVAMRFTSAAWWLT